jgi:HAD superfamily hydrolase (TIGR01484 family)
LKPDRRIRLLALDVDGTLLGDAGEPRPGLAAALQAAQDRGLRLILCTGRRYRRAAAAAERFGLDAPLVCNSGAIVKDPRSHSTLWRADLHPETVARLLRLIVHEGKQPLSFVDHGPSGPDFTIEAYPTGDPDFDDYVAANRDHAAIEPGWVARAIQGLGRTHFHFCALGDRPRMLRLAHHLTANLPGEILCFVQRSPRYHAWMCELLRADAGKWSALCQIAQRWGILPGEICAIGDDVNDRPMIAAAGCGVAMPHAPPEVREVADFVLPDQPDTALANFVLGLCR